MLLNLIIILQNCVNKLTFIFTRKYIFIFLLLQFESKTFLDFIENDSNKNINNNSIDDKINRDFLNDEKNKYIQLNNRIKQLEIDLNNEKEKNKKLNEKIEKYKKNINYLNDKLSENNLVYKNKLLEYQNKIKEKIDEINVLKSKLNDSNINNIQPGEKIIAVGFTSSDQTIQNFFRPCKDSDLFVKIEEKLYDEYPQYKDLETYFLVNGKKILRFKSMKENNIKNGQIIMLNIIE